MSKEISPLGGDPMICPHCAALVVEDRVELWPEGVHFGCCGYVVERPVKLEVVKMPPDTACATS